MRADPTPEKNTESKKNTLLVSFHMHRDIKSLNHSLIVVDLVECLHSYHLIRQIHIFQILCVCGKGSQEGERGEKPWPVVMLQWTCYVTMDFNITVMYCNIPGLDLDLGFTVVTQEQ